MQEKQISQDFMEIEIKIAFKSMQLMGFSFTEAGSGDANDKIPPERFEFSFVPKLSMNSKQKTVDVSLQTEIKDLNSKELYATIDTKFGFYLENYEELIIEESDSVSIAPPLIPLLAGAAVSTTRGMLLNCVSNSRISNAVIPIVDASKMFGMPDGVRRVPLKQKEPEA